MSTETMATGDLATASDFRLNVTTTLTDLLRHLSVELQEFPAERFPARGTALRCLQSKLLDSVQSAQELARYE